LTIIKIKDIIIMQPIENITREKQGGNQETRMVYLAEKQPNK